MQSGEFPVAAVVKFLRQKGLTLSDSVGNELGRIYPEMCAIGILEKCPDYPLEKRHTLVGVLDFCGYHEKLKFGGWVFCIQGLRHFRQLANLAKELCQHFQVRIAPLLLCTPGELSELSTDELVELKNKLSQILEPS